MQLLNAPPRQALTVAQVTALLTGNRVEVSAGCDVLNLDLTVNTDYGTAGVISDDLLAGSVVRNMNARIHGTCRLDLSVELAWGAVLVRPFVVLSDGGVEARFNVGVFMLTTPERPIGETPVTFQAQGFDRVYLLDREVGDDYAVTAGTTYRQALIDVFADADLTGYLIDSEAASYTLPVTRTWALVGSSTDPDQTSTPVTWLRIVNDLLLAINFRGVWADHDGLFRCERYLSPIFRAPEFVFDATSITASIVAEDRVVISDMWKTPNRWVFIWSNRPGGESATEGVGRYTVNNVADGPTSQTARGLIWPKVYRYEAASYALLVTIGDRRVAADRRLASMFQVATGPFPAAGHADVFTYIDEATVQVQALSWELDLLGGDTRWTWEEVTA